MNSNVLITRVKIKHWWVIFGVLQGVLLAFMICSLCVGSWVSARFSDVYQFIYYSSRDGNVEISRYFKGDEFAGSLSFCLEGCDDEMDSYSNLYEDWCYGDMMDEYKQDSDYKDIKSICTMFSVLSGGSAVYVVFELVSIVALITWFVSMLCFTKVLVCYYAGCWCSICSCMSHLIATLFWFSITQASFISCSSFPDNGQVPTVCAEAGPALSLVTLILYPFILVVYMVISNKIKIKKKEYLSVIHSNTSEFTNRASNQVGIFDPTGSTRALVIHPPYPGFAGVPNVMLPPSLPSHGNSVYANRQRDLIVQDYQDLNQYGLNSMPPCVNTGDLLQKPNPKPD